MGDETVMKIRKTAAFILTSVMLLSLATVSSFANDPIAAYSEDVMAKYSNEVVTPAVYSIDVSWEKMEFTYTVTGTKTWDPATKEFSVDTSGSWTPDGNTVTVKNNSNRAVNARFEFTPLDAYPSISGTFTEQSAILASAAETSDETALAVSTQMTLTGELPDTITSLTKIGMVTVILSGVPEPVQ